MTVTEGLILHPSISWTEKTNHGHSK